MTATPVEWVLVILYNVSAHRATYGRLSGTKYTKDYIQLHKRKEFLSEIGKLFPSKAGNSTPLTFKWPLGTAPGSLVFQSADRPHLKWETHLGAPDPWKMTLAPSDVGPETIPGDPGHSDPSKADNEYALIASRGAGQPYLVAIKLVGEANILHLRAYLAKPDKKFSWADVALLPKEVQDLAGNITSRRASASSGFSGKVYFDPDRNHDAWKPPTKPVSTPKAAPTTSSATVVDDDITAEGLDVSSSEVAAFNAQIDSNNFSVGDSVGTSKTRGSAQRAFANRVKANYKSSCAVTGISTKDFLVASHIVPWSQDQSIRLDPSNGICLSLLMDRAFENGYLVIKDDYSISIDWKKVGSDKALNLLLGPYDGTKLNAPKTCPPKVEYLKRRRALVSAKAGH